MRTQIQRAVMGGLFAAAVSVGACLPSLPGAECSDGWWCPEGYRCENQLCQRSETEIEREIECGNAIVEADEECDDGDINNDDDCHNDCTINRSMYVKSSNIGQNYEFGRAVALSDYGAILAVGACGEASAAKDIDGDQADNSAPDAGAVYVFTRSGMSRQQAYVKASNTDRDDEFGVSVALSMNGATLAVGAAGEASAAQEIDGDQANNSAPDAGAVYVFTRSDTTWSQQAYIKASNTDASDRFGVSVALSADGSTLAVGAPGEASAATGIGDDQTDDSAPAAGAVYVFTRSGPTWSQQAYVKAFNTDRGDEFGVSVALSADGLTLAVGATGEDSRARGIDGDQADNSATAAGAVYVFTRSGLTWSQGAYIKASNTGVDDQFGTSVALSADGSTLAVGAIGEDSAAIGINGDQNNDFAKEAGAVYVFTRSDTTWSQQAYVKASNTGSDDEFGVKVALSADGSTLAVGATGEDSRARGIGGDQADNSTLNAGAVYVFTRRGTRWGLQAYVKASNTGVDDRFGTCIALSKDGLTLAVGAEWEDSAATGIGGNQFDNSTLNAGAVYVHRLSGGCGSFRARSTEAIPIT